MRLDTATTDFLPAAPDVWTRPPCETRAIIGKVLRVLSSPSALGAAVIVIV